MNGDVHIAWRLFRQDPALRTLTASLIFALGGGALILLAGDGIPGFEQAQAPGAKAGWFNFALFLVWSLLMIVTAGTKINIRASLMSLGLPMRARSLWLVRLGAILLAGAAPLLVLTVLVSVRRWTAGFPAPDGFTLGVGGQLLSGFVLAVFLFQTPFAGLRRIDWSWAYVVYCLLMAVLVWMVILLVPPSPLAVIIPAVLGLALGLRIYFALPRSFATHHREPEGDWGQENGGLTPISAAHRDERSQVGANAEMAVCPPFSKIGVRPRSFFWLKQMTIWRLLLNRWISWIGMLTLLSHGILLGAGYFDGRPLLVYLIVCAVWVYGLVDNASQRAHRLEPYPIPKRTLFAHVVVTSLVVFLAGLAIGLQRDAAKDPRGPMLLYKDRQVEVPAEFREIAWGGRPPSISSPWGESHTPTAYRLLPWSDVALFNPYESGRENSAEFVALQGARAVEVVHGIPVPSAYRQVGFQLDEQQRELIETCCFPVEGSKGRGSDTRSRTYAIVTLLVGLIGIVVFNVALRRYSKTLHGTLFRWIPLGSLIAVGLIVTLAIAIQALGFSRAWAVEAFFMVLARQLAVAVPVPTPALWGIVFLAFVGFGFILLRRFEKIEANPASAEKPTIEEY